MPTLPSSPPPVVRRTATVAAVTVAAVTVAVHVAVLYWPVVSVTGPVSWTDKVVHVLVFAIPTYAVGLVLHRASVAVLAFLVHAPLSELVQHLALPNRSGDLSDVVVDVVGVAVAAGLLLVRRRRER